MKKNKISDQEVFNFLDLLSIHSEHAMHAHVCVPMYVCKCKEVTTLSTSLSHNKWFKPFLVGLQYLWSINVLGSKFLIKIKDIVCSHFG